MHLVIITYIQNPRSRGKSFILPWILPTHLHFVSGPLPAFPEPAAGFADEDVFAYTACFGTVDLFAGAEATVAVDVRIA